MLFVTDAGLHLLRRTHKKVSQNTRMKWATIPEGCEGPHENLGVAVTLSALEVFPGVTEGGWKRERMVHGLSKVSAGHVVTAHEGCNIVHREITLTL
jgi:hypothetical protein